jgi:molybdopterin-biosynthesis enzyme MoeA-like protein
MSDLVPPREGPFPLVGARMDKNGRWFNERGQQLGYVTVPNVVVISDDEARLLRIRTKNV